MMARNNLLRGEFFKIILKDATTNPSEGARKSTSDTGSGTTSATSTPSGKQTSANDSLESKPATPEYFIHKSLLSSLSVELYNHAYNDMKEGRENVIELSEIDVSTLEAFLEWAYYKDYKDSILDDSSTLLSHIKVYVLSDRFNITPLKELAFAKISALLANMGMVKSRVYILAVTEAATYAYENLPLCRAKANSVSTTSTDTDTTPIAPTERLLSYLAQYIAWALDIFRYNDEFMRLIGNNPDFTDALITSCRPASVPPWMLDVTSASDSDVEMITFDATNKDHILHRKCGACAYTGIMKIKCLSCNAVDSEVGLDLKHQESHVFTVGKSRLSGTKQNFRYTCKWCKVISTYDTSNKSFVYNGTTYTRSSWEGYLWCRKCLNPGFVSPYFSIV